MHTVPRRVLPVLVLAQLGGTSLWFAVNAVMPDLQRSYGWPVTAVGTHHLGAAVRLHLGHAGVCAAGHCRPLQRAARVRGVRTGRGH